MNLDDNDLDLGGGMILHKSAVEAASGFKKVTETYNEYAKLVFIFDVSGSMNSRIVTDTHGESYINEYLWVPGKLDEIGAKTGEVIQKVNALLLAGDPMYIAALTPDEQEYLKLTNPERGSFGEFVFTPADDDDFKSRIVRNDLCGTFGIYLDASRKPQEPPTRIGVVRKLAKQEIHRRFKKYPKSRIAVIPFSGVAAPLFDDGTEEEIDAAIDKLNMSLQINHDNGSVTHMDGGTHIMNALAVAMKVCADKPSAVGIHHFILVTDGEDHSTYDLPSWIPNMKASGVVLDYIHIGDTNANPALKAACTSLGGDFVVVNSEKELEAKFFQAATRLLAPPSNQ